MPSRSVEDALGAERDDRLAHDGAEPVELVVADLSLADVAARHFVRGSSHAVRVLYLSPDAYGLANTAAPGRFGTVLTMPFDSMDLLKCVRQLLGDRGEPPPDAPRPAA